MKAVFLDLETIGPQDIDLTPLSKQLPELESFSTTRSDQISERIADAEIVIVNKVRLNDEVLRSARKLKLICLAATGTDNVDLTAAESLNIAVCNIRDYCTPSVVQHVFALILSLNNHLREYEQSLSDGAWSAQTSFTLLDHPIRELGGKTLGIVGLGTLGRAVAETAGFFGMHVIASHSFVQDKGETIERVSLDELLERADIISLHCPLTDQTENLINKETLGKMRRDAVLINTARGGLVDSAALVEALENGSIAGAGIDVLRQEPPVDADPILEAKLSNLIVTPHIAWSTRESRQRAVEEIAANVASYSAGDSRHRLF